jgi:hypothetical protein
MGVMPCYREGCENIMCDRYNSEFGYICNECFAELVEFANINNGGVVTDEFIVGFMTTNKKSYKQKKVDARECLEEIFPGY